MSSAQGDFVDKCHGDMTEVVRASQRGNLDDQIASEDQCCLSKTTGSDWLT